MTFIAGAIGFMGGTAAAIDPRAIASLRQFSSGSPRFAKLQRGQLAIALSLLLPEDAYDRQPLDDDRFTLVADVRLDNRADLIAALGPGAERLTGAADSDIILAAWQRWGRDCLSRFCGPFALACYDGRQQQLTLARDALGDRPLFFEEHGGTLRFASMPSGVIGAAKPVVDVGWLGARLGGVAIGPMQTGFEGVASLQPGHFASFDHTGLSTGEFRRIEPGPSGQREWLQEFRFLLDQAVSSQLRTAAPAVAAQLSSGYDSSAVTGTAARLMPSDKRLIALTSAPLHGARLLTSTNRIGDESAIAAATAAGLGIEHDVLRERSCVLASLEGAAWAFQEPLNNLFNHGWWMATLREAGQRGASSMLIGTAGNQTISFGGPAVLPTLLRTGNFGQWLRESRLSVRNNSNRWRGILKASFEPWLPDAIGNRLARRSAFDFRTAEAIALATPRLQQRGGSLFEERLASLRNRSSGQFGKGLLALTGVEERDPTADLRLAEFCLSMPPELLLKDGVYRPLARAALADRVPQAVLNARHRGYQGADWFARLDPALAPALLEEISPNATVNQLLDLARLGRAIDDWPDLATWPFAKVFAWGRGVTQALAAGKFIVDIERGPPG